MAQTTVSRTDDGYLVRFQYDDRSIEIPLSFAEAAPLGSLLVESRIPNEAGLAERLAEAPFLSANRPLFALR